MTWRTALLLFWIQIAAVPPAPVQKGAIEGVALRIGTRTPVEGALVGLLPPYGEAIDFNAGYVGASTDDQGKFVLKDVDPGRYRITIAANGFVRQEFGQRTFPGNGTLIRLESGQTLKDLSIELTPTGTVTGTIRDADQRPLTGVPVQLLRFVYDEYGDKFLRLAAFNPEMVTLTDDRGDFRIYHVTPGRYYLSAGTPNGPSSFLDPQLGANQVREVFSYAYYPGVSDLNFSSMIGVQPGESKVGMDMTLNRQRGVRVSGRLIDAATGQPPENPTILLRYNDDIRGPNSYRDLEASGREKVTYKDGNFEFQNVLPGRFTVVAEMDEPGSSPVRTADGTYIPGLRRTGYVPVAVGSTDVAGLLVTIAPGASLKGRLRVEGNGEIPPTVEVRLDPSSEVRSAIPGFPYPSRWRNPDGTFQLDNVMPGEYRFVVEWDKPPYYVKEARFGTIDLLKDLFRFSGREQGTIDVLLSPNVASIEGMVTDRFAPAKGARVVLVPDGSRHRLELFKTTVTDQNGRFFIQNVAPGDYKLYSWEAIEPYGWFDPKILERDERSAQPIHVMESARQNVDSILIVDR